MNKVKLNDVIKSGNLVIPMNVLKEYSKFDLTLDEFVLLIYLYNNNNIIYDPELLSNKLGISIENVLIGVDSLGNKGLLSLDSFTNSNGVLEEKINMDVFYEKITLSLINELNEEISDNNIFSLIEKEFDRKLKPNEQELVISLQKDYSDELIKEALKEAKNNNPTVRYMDQVLFDWKKQGVKSLDDINKIKEVSNEPIDSIINVKWFEDDEV